MVEGLPYLQSFTRTVLGPEHKGRQPYNPLHMESKVNLHFKCSHISFSLLRDVAEAVEDYATGIMVSMKAKVKVMEPER